MTDYKNFRVETDERGVRTATLDVPDRPVNVFEDSVLIELNDIVTAARHEASQVKMLVFRSGKQSGFLAGADIHRLQQISNREEAEWILQQGQSLFNNIQQLPFPTLAVVHGACMGGGLEFALACTYRLAVDHPSTKMGLPEVKLGLLPGWGGTQRLPRQVGMAQALSMMLQGSSLSAEKARKSNLVDGLIRSRDADDEINAFINDRLAGRSIHSSKRSWLDWAIDSSSLGRKLAVKQARKQTARQSKHYPALTRILDAVEAGASSKKVSEAGLKAERDGFCDLLFGDVAPHLINLFLLQETAKKASTWTDSAEPHPVQKIAVIGAGTMGAGIAQLAAVRGFSVVLQDVKQEFLDRGMKTIRDLLDKAVKKSAMTQQDADAALSRITTRVGWSDSGDIDCMVEAVVENIDIKKEIFHNADEQLPIHGVLASNTSALPIDKMADATERPEKVAGLHFFNPVHKMPLVEVVRAPHTSDETIATLIGVSKKLGKVPIVVNQSPGFLVNRILFPYLDEAGRLMCEGYSAKEIDREAKAFGMPVGPLELIDVVGIDVARDVSRSLSKLAGQETPAPELLQRLVDNGHLGQKSGKGFYHWKDGKKGDPVELTGFEPTPLDIQIDNWTPEGETFSPIQQRLILVMINEARKCLVENVVSEPWVVDLGMVLGTGFAPFRGGPMACLEKWGTVAVDQRLSYLAGKLGSRFEPCCPKEGTSAAQSVPGPATASHG